MSSRRLAGLLLARKALASSAVGSVPIVSKKARRTKTSSEQRCAGSMPSFCSWEKTHRSMGFVAGETGGPSNGSARRFPAKKAAAAINDRAEIFWPRAEHTLKREKRDMMILTLKKARPLQSGRKHNTG